jgi:hypothetical protein
MAVKVGRMKIGNNPAEQLELERKRFQARNRPKKLIGEREKTKEEKRLEERKHWTDYD